MPMEQRYAKTIQCVVTLENTRQFRKKLIVSVAARLYIGNMRWCRESRF